MIFSLSEFVRKMNNPKIVFGFILFFAVIGVGASGYRISRGIQGGFVPPSDNVGNGLKPFPTNADNESLKTKDTDGDGLSDYDELNGYQTSPYLSDTDSDGMNDAEEVAKQSDPNCPEGRDCREIAPSGSGDVSDKEMDIMTEATAGLDIGPKGVDGEADAVELTTEAEANKQLENLTPAQVKQLLIDSGKVSKEQLDKIDDETLMRVYQEVIVQ